MPLNIVFENGKLVDESQLNALVLLINENESRIENLQSIFNSISKSQLIVLASKASQQILTTNGQNNIITGLNPQINVGSILNATTGIITTPTTGTYTIEAKSLLSADNAQSTRSKLTILAGGNPVGISEDTIFSTNPVIVSNYRYTHSTDTTVQLNTGVPVMVVAQVWGATTGRIFGDINTSIKMWLEL